MSAINVTQVSVLDNPAFFLAPLKFEIQYECLQPLQKDLEWKLTYVGSAESDAHDQELDVVLVGPVAVGSYKFVFQADPPDHNKIPASDLLGVTVLLLTCAYDGVEFIRVGYYVNNEYADEELKENPPENPHGRLDRVVRNILEEKPRVTRFPCEFDTPSIPTAASMDDYDEMENMNPGGAKAGEFGVGGEGATTTHSMDAHGGFAAGHGLSEYGHAQ